MSEAKDASEVLFSKDTPYLALTGELWGVICEDLGENWPLYNGTALYLKGDWLCDPLIFSTKPVMRNAFLRHTIVIVISSHMYLQPTSLLYCSSICLFLID